MSDRLGLVPGACRGLEHAVFQVPVMPPPLPYLSDPTLFYPACVSICADVPMVLGLPVLCDCLSFLVAADFVIAEVAIRYTKCVCMCVAR